MKLLVRASLEDDVSLGVKEDFPYIQDYNALAGHVDIYDESNNRFRALQQIDKDVVVFRVADAEAGFQVCGGTVDIDVGLEPNWIPLLVEEKNFSDMDEAR